jgi:hypothetical protein
MAIRLESQLDSWPGMAICTRRVRVWKLTRGCTRTRPGVKTGAGANSHPQVPIGPRQPKTHLIEFLTFLPKPAGTRNLPGAGAV